MSAKKNQLSMAVQLALFGIIILNLAIGIVHLLGRLIPGTFPVWEILPYVSFALTVFMSWQILQLVGSSQINFGFQLGGLWVVISALVDFLLYILPHRGPVLNTYAELSNHLLINYLVIFLAPTAIGVIQRVRSNREG